MTTILPAKCPHCGADLNVPATATSVRCSYCNKDVILNLDRTGQRADNRLRLASAAAQAGNHEEAYRYYTLVLEDDPENYEAWFGKAVAAGWGSGLRSDRFGELIAGIDMAMQYAPDNVKASLAARAAAEIDSITGAFFALSHKHTIEFIALDDTWDEHVGRNLSTRMRQQA